MEWHNTKSLTRSFHWLDQCLCCQYLFLKHSYVVHQWAHCLPASPQIYTVLGTIGLWQQTNNYKQEMLLFCFMFVNTSSSGMWCIIWCLFLCWYQEQASNNSLQYVSFLFHLSKKPRVASDTANHSSRLVMPVMTWQWQFTVVCSRANSMFIGCQAKEITGRNSCPRNQLCFI